MEGDIRKDIKNFVREEEKKWWRFRTEKGAAKMLQDYNVMVRGYLNGQKGEYGKALLDSVANGIDFASREQGGRGLPRDGASDYRLLTEAEVEQLAEVVWKQTKTDREARKQCW